MGNSFPEFAVYWKNLENGKHCKYCEMAKNLLYRLGHTFTALNIEESPHNDFFALGGYKTVPQIFVRLSEKGEWKHVGGYDDLVKWLENFEG